MTLAFLLKLLEVAPAAITELKGDVSKVLADPDAQSKLADSIKTVEDALDELKTMISA